MVCNYHYLHLIKPLSELNQNSCSNIFPVAVSLIQSTPLNTSRTVTLLRPSITALTSCIANNSKINLIS